MKIQREQSAFRISSFVTVNSTKPKFVRFILAGYGGTYDFNPCIWEAKQEALYEFEVTLI